MQTVKVPTLQKTMHPLKIIAVGDSIIYGFGDPAGADGLSDCGVVG